MVVQIALGFVKHEVDGIVFEMYLAAVDADSVDLGVDFTAEFGHDPAVYTHASGGHEVLRATSARNARTGEELLQAHGKRLFGRCIRHGYPTNSISSSSGSSSSSSSSGSSSSV